MKVIKLSLVIMAAALLTIGLGGMAYAFHDGGVGTCESCHTMHNSSGGTAMFGGGSSSQNPKKGTVPQFSGVNYLLQGSDQSSTCLNCHGGATLSSYHVFTTGSIAGIGPANYTPGGDFAWLTKSWTAISHGSALPGERLGHNVIAADFSLAADSTLSKAPGGTYSNQNLTCVSCHDPHPKARIDSTYTIVRPSTGNAVPPIYTYGSYGDAPTATEAVGVYRLLGGNGYVPKSYSGGPAFSADPPIAVAPTGSGTAGYNRKETTTDTRVAYGSGMSEWCANCHGSIHNNGLSSAFIHPASNAALLTATVTANYNAYKKSGDLTNTQATSYTSLIPFEEGLGLSAANITTLKSHAGGGTGSTAGPSTGKENVMCLTCHRAHASGFRSMARWDNDTEFITETGAYNVGTATGNRNPVEYQAAMYDRPAGNFATYQRSLCNKCHVKD